MQPFEETMKTKDNSTLLVRGQLLDSGLVADVLVCNGLVRDISVGKLLGKPDLGSDETLLAPALADMQVNGGFGIDLQRDDLVLDEVIELGRKLAAHGVARWVPTLVTAPVDSMERRAWRIVEALTADPATDASVPGIHFEGPFISRADGPRGAHPREHALEPSLSVMKRLVNAAGGRVACVTLAPELPGAPALIRALSKQSIVAALGHHAANATQVAKAAESGATLCTHLGNGLATTIHRHHNPVWPQLANDRLHASFIADLHHLPEEALKAMIWAKGPERCILVSDAVCLAGMKPGKYRLFGADVEKRKDGKVCLAGTELLAGSGTLLLDGVINAWLAADLTMGEAFDCASMNPLQLLGIPAPPWPPRKGRRAEFIGFHLETRQKRIAPSLEFSLVGGTHHPPDA
jgi:N-acetylglucosamine-6-phosphate deacetylase